MCGSFQRISWYSPSPWATTVGERAGPEPRSSLVDVSQWMMVALHVTVNRLETHRCWDVVSRIGQGKGSSKHTIDRAYGEAEPAVLVSVESEQDG